MYRKNRSDLRLLVREAFRCLRCTQGEHPRPGRVQARHQGQRSMTMFFALFAAVTRRTLGFQSARRRPISESGCLPRVGLGARGEAFADRSDSKMTISDPELTNIRM